MDSKLNTNLLYTLDPCKIMKDQNQHIQVFVRVRPRNSYEQSKKLLDVLDCPSHQEIVVHEKRTLNNLNKTYKFDQVFGPTSKQIEVYKIVVGPLIEQVLLGYNCTVFTYGQTGSGKTFTMEGEQQIIIGTTNNTESSSLTWENDTLAGIVPRALSQLFDELHCIPNIEFTVCVSFLELYNEEIYDLLSPIHDDDDDQIIRTLKLYEDTTNKKGSIIIQGLEEKIIHSKYEVYKIMEHGSLKRKTAPTLVNTNSSRSHTIFIVTVSIKECNVEGEELLKIGKLYLVDLAGSENIGRSGTIEKRAKEGGSINQSLLTLGRVITALVERASHVPYRESKLTRILQDSLGGKTKTSIIATVSPTSYDVNETLSTLDYVHRAKYITIRPEINQKLTKRGIIRKDYTMKIEKLRCDLVEIREKNGIYIDKENYLVMAAKLDYQNQDLSDTITKVRSMKNILKQKEVELTCVKREWDEMKKDLVTCNQVLEETRLKLQRTLLKLREAELNRDEQEYLVENYVVTEKKLTSEATQLLCTTEESTSNLDKLHGKLERKKLVEEKNLEAGRRFNKYLGNQFDSMYISLETFHVHHTSFCKVQKMKLDTFLQNKNQQFTSLSNEIINFLKKMSYLFISTQTMVDTENNYGKNWSTSIERQISRISVDTINDIDLWKEKIMNEIIVKLDEQLKSPFEQMKKFGSDFKDLITLQGTLINNFITTLVYKLEENSKTIEKYLNEQILAKNDEREWAGQTKHLTDEFTNIFERTITNICSDVQIMVQNANDFKSILENNSMSQVTNITKSRSMLEEFKTEVQHDFDTNQIEMNLLGNNFKNLSTLAKMNFHKEMEEYYKSSIDGVQYIADIQEGIQKHTSNQKDLWVQTQEYIISPEMYGQEKHLNRSIEQYKQMAQVIENQMNDGDNIKEILKTIDINHKMDQDFVYNELNEFGQHCNISSEWADEKYAIVLQQSKKLKEFWDSIYMIDIPTGTTPQQKIYDYPKSFSQTSPHERIISRFTTNRRPVPVPVPPIDLLENNVM